MSGSLLNKVTEDSIKGFFDDWKQIKELS